MAAEYEPSIKEIDREQRLINDPVWQAARPELLALVRGYQASTTASAMMTVQLNLIASVRARQQRIKELRAELDAVRQRRTTLAAAQPKDVAALREVQTQISGLEQLEFVHVAFRHLLLNIGDAIAWRTVGFDRAAITILGQGQRVSWLSDGPGWAAEVSALEENWREGRFSLLTDLTTCLRHGDLVTDTSDRFLVTEVKAGGPARLQPRAERRILDATSFINEGRAVIDGIDSFFHRCPARYRTFMPALRDALQQARARGEANARPSPSQLLVTHDMRHFTTQNDRVPTPIDQFREQTRWPQDDVIFTNGSLLRRMRDRHHTFATLAPLAVYPLPAEDVTDLLMGYLAFSTVLNASVFARRLEAAGYTADVWRPPESGMGFLTVAREEGVQLLTTQVAPHFREMMMLELLTPSACEKATEFMLGLLRSNATEHGQHMIVLADEHRTWR